MSTTELWVVAWRQWVEETGGVHERRKRCVHVDVCDHCGGRLEFWDETEEWTEHNGRWIHASYGPAAAVCETCEMLYFDGFEGCEVYDLSKSKEPAP